MSENKWEQLVAGLLGQTSAGVLDWDSPSDDTMVVLLGDGAIHVVKETRDEYSLTLFDRLGRLLEQTSVTRQTYETGVFRDVPFFDEVDRLWDMARLNALKVDEVWRSALDALRDSHSGDASLDDLA